MTSAMGENVPLNSSLRDESEIAEFVRVDPQLALPGGERLQTHRSSCLTAEIATNPASSVTPSLAGSTLYHLRSEGCRSVDWRATTRKPDFVRNCSA